MATEESKVEAIFYLALEKQASEDLAVYLDEACAEDAILRQRVEALLSARPKLGNFLQGHAADMVATSAPPPYERPGTQIGPYKLLQQLGEGGMGVVYMAEQTEPVQRKVALKVIKPGMDSRQVIARFEAERQALAVLGLAGPTIAGEQVPFRGILAGSFTQAPIPGTPTALVVARGSGQATMLGHFSFDFPLTVNVVLQTGSGIYTFTAANGDTVVAEVLAISSLLPNGLRRVQEIGTITGGTGRFADATGSFVGERFLDRATGDVFCSFEVTISTPGANNP